MYLSDIITAFSGRFKGKGIGVDADIASLDFRETNLRSLKHLEGGYHVPQRFKERIGATFCASHIFSLTEQFRGPIRAAPVSHIPWLCVLLQGFISPRTSTPQTCAAVCR